MAAIAVFQVNHASFLLVIPTKSFLWLVTIFASIIRSSSDPLNHNNARPRVCSFRYITTCSFQQIMNYTVSLCFTFLWMFLFLMSTIGSLAHKDWGNWGILFKPGMRTISSSGGQQLYDSSPYVSLICAHVFLWTMHWTDVCDNW